MGRSARWVSWLLLGLGAGVACGEVRRQSPETASDAGAMGQDPDSAPVTGGASGRASGGLAGRSMGGKQAVGGASTAGSSTLSSAGLSFGPVPDSPEDCPQDCTAAVAFTYDPASMCLSAEPDEFLGCACGRVDGQSEFGCYIDRASGRALVT